MNIDNSVNNNMFTHFKSLEGMKGIYEGFCKASMSFKFDRIVWKVIEDQYDGYRSQIDWIIYGDQDIEFENQKSDIALLEKWEDSRTSGYEIFCGWVLRKSNNGEVLLMIGTDYSDEFYPHTVLDTYM